MDSKNQAAICDPGRSSQAAALGPSNVTRKESQRSLAATLDLCSYGRTEISFQDDAPRAAAWEDLPGSKAQRTFWVL